jgi:antibiotic biosynthesis monooxygenase (ABM) superfamily enzyme
MIARIWRGWARAADADRYECLFRDEVLPHVTRGVPGYLGTDLLRREMGDEVEFTTIFRFDSMEAIHDFAGEDPEKAVVPARVRSLLTRFDERVTHHELCPLD